MKRKVFSVFFALMLVLSMSLVTAVPVSAATITTVTPTDITVGPTYTPLTGPVLAEDSAGEFTVGTIILTAPAGFTFDTGVSVTATVTGAGTPLLLNGAATQVVTPTTSTITIGVSALSVTEPSTITYTGIRIKDSDDTSGTTGNLVFSGTSNVTGSAGTLTSVPDVIDHFALVTENAGTEVAGTAFTITVTAQDEFDNTATSYIGAAVSVAFTSTATAAPDTTSPTIPTPQILDFSATPGIVTATGFILVNAAETPTITADDGTYSGTSTGITVDHAAALAAYTVVPDGLTQTAGVAFDVVITAVDEFENPLGTDYTDPGAAYTWETTASDPSDIDTLAYGDFTAGVATMLVTLNVIETGKTFTVTDSNDPAITGTSAGVAVVAGPEAYLEVTGDAEMSAGATNELTVTAYDSADNVATSYTGSKTLVFSGLGVAPDATAPTVEGVTMENETTVTFTLGVSSGTNATLIAYNAEMTTVDVTDGTVNSFAELEYDLDLTVDPAAAAQLAYTVEPGTVVAGVETTAFVVRRQDQYANPVISGETIVGLASDSTWTDEVFRDTPSGDAVTQVTIPDTESTVPFYYYDELAGDWTITASGLTTPGLSLLTVDPAGIDHYAVEAITSPQVIGATFPVTIQAQDMFNNDITTGGEAITITYGVTDGSATPTTTTTAAGTVTVPVRLTVITLGQSITFTGAGGTGTSNPFQTVDVGAIDHYAVTAISVTQEVGEPFTVTIQAQDANNNDITLGPDVAEAITITFGLPDADAMPITTNTTAGTATVSNMTMTVAQAGQTITFTGATSGATVTTAAFSVYDEIMPLPDVWVLISTPLWISSDSAWIPTVIEEPVLVYKAAGSVFSSEVTLAEDLKPVEALYVKMGSGGGALGIIFSTDVQGVSAKELVAGWNLISSASSESAQAVLSGLQDVATDGTGLTTVVSQGIYNAPPSVGFYVDATNWDNLIPFTLEPIEGYWIRMNADKTFGVVPQP